MDIRNYTISDLLSLLVVIVASFGVVVAGFFALGKFWLFLELGSLSRWGTYSLGQLWILPMIMICHALIWLPAIYISAWKRCGLLKLKPVSENGLLAGVVEGFRIGISGAIVGGFILLVVEVFFIGFIGAIVCSTVCAFVVAPSVGFLFGLVDGLRCEFR